MEKNLIMSGFWRKITMFYYFYHIPKHLPLFHICQWKINNGLGMIDMAIVFGKSF